jgi:mannose-6-phosphate isomerase class I
MTRSVLVPRSDNFTPEERTPWGGVSIVQEMKAHLTLFPGIKVVSESWEISGHQSFPNIFSIKYAGEDLEVNISTLEKLFPVQMYGQHAVKYHGGQMPFLVKIINSGSWRPFFEKLEKVLAKLDSSNYSEKWRQTVGVKGSLVEILRLNYDDLHKTLSVIQALGKKYVKDADDVRSLRKLQSLHQKMLTKNLSVQVHPPADYKGLTRGEHSKTEAWIILDAEPGAGIYLGFKEGVSKERFYSALKDGEDITSHLNFVQVRAGDVFLIPAGVMHALGAGVLLIEPQETSETTYRFYDYGRVDKNGKPRKLHIENAMAATIWEGLRGVKAVNSFRRAPVLLREGGNGMARVEQIIEENAFATMRIKFAKGEEYTGEGGRGVVGYTVLEGIVEVFQIESVSPTGRYMKGQSFIIPAAMGKCRIKGKADVSIVIETSVFMLHIPHCCRK